MLTVLCVLCYSCLTPQKAVLVTIQEVPVKLIRLALVTTALVLVAQVVMAVSGHWAATTGVTPREPVHVIFYTHSGCEDRPALTQPFGDLSPEEHSLTPDGHDTPTWKAPRTPNTP